VTPPTLLLVTDHTLRSRSVMSSTPSHRHVAPLRGPTVLRFVAAGPGAGLVEGDPSVCEVFVDGETGTDMSTMVGKIGALSYNEQYDDLYRDGPEGLKISKPVAKPDIAAQADVPGARRIPGSAVHAVARSDNLFKRLLKGDWHTTDYIYCAYMTVVHALCLWMPATFSPAMVGLFFATYFVTGCLGITLSYHRQLSHRSFQTPKWLEYALAYCGVLAVQGDPIEWVSAHRYHHLHTDTPLDPHSPYEGFWWSHMGWLMDHRATRDRVHDTSNANDLNKQTFYRFIQKTYGWHVVAQFVALYALGGFPALVWGGAARLVWVYHVTWLVNSASHLWGDQPYRTGDLSVNNWWVGILAWGEGWHNNHHAFEFSARHGLEWWQVDVTWGIIKALQTVGLATCVKLPSQRQMRRLRAVDPALSEGSEWEPTPGAA